MPEILDVHDILALKMSHASTVIMNDRQKPQNFQNKLNTQQRCVNFVNHLDRIRILAILCPVKSKVKATWSLVFSSCCVLWIDNWYRAQYTTHPGESDRSQNCTAMAVLQLKQRPTYWAGHPAIEDLAARITTVARALQQRERRIPQTLRDMGYADGCAPDTGNVRAPLDVRRDARTVQSPVWRPFALSKEKVTGGVDLLNLLHFAKDVAQQTNRVLPLLVDKNIHYRILKLLYGAKNQRWNMRAYLGYVPVVYSVWHAYKFVVTHTFRVFWPILTYLRKGLLRPGSTILSYPNR